MAAAPLTTPILQLIDSLASYFVHDGHFSRKKFCFGISYFRVACVVWFLMFLFYEWHHANEVYGDLKHDHESREKWQHYLTECMQDPQSTQNILGGQNYAHDYCH